MKYPRISIVTPSFNQAEFLEETINSVISQRYPNLEYIIIDGGSTDGSVEIIRKYDKYLSYWCSEKDRGHADALNKGFSKSSGEIMAWINSDDKYFEWTFKTISEIYSEFSQIEWTVGLYANFDREGVLMSGSNNIRAIYKNVFSYLFGDLHIQQESVFWRRSLWNKSGGFISDKVNLMIDTELWCRFFLHSDLYHIDQVIGGYRTYGLNRSHNNSDKVTWDINYSIGYLKDNISEKAKLKYNEIIQYSNLFKNYNSEIEFINKKLDKNLLLKIIPSVYYKKLKNYLFKNNFNKSEPHKPNLKDFDFKVIKKDNQNQWFLEIIPYNFPY